MLAQVASSYLSIRNSWDALPPVHDLVQTSGALHQCFFGAETAKPTRFASNLPAAQVFGVHWHTLQEDGTYAGPLERCPHAHTSHLIGWEEGWRSSHSAAYPPALCKYLAFLIFSAVPSLDATVAAPAAQSLDIPHPAEAFALTIAGCPTAAEVLILFDLLPKTRPHAKAGLAPGSAFFAGAVKGDAGVHPRPTTRQFPMAVQKLCQFIQAADAAHPFAAFVILRNVHSALHRDHNNSSLPNLLVPITAFEGDGVWIEDAASHEFRWHQGTLVAGTAHSFADGPIYLRARDLLHETMPWTGDRAIVLDRPKDAVGSTVLESFDPGTSRAFGQPMICRYEMGKKEFTDGFGLCSPGRWAPEAREMLASPEEAGHAKTIREILKDFVCDEIKDLRASAFKLATGKLEQSPFCAAALERVRKEIAAVLGGSPDILE
ncbi:unnamed protein product, partial [Symbiodinium sp. CCMP2592]